MEIPVFKAERRMETGTRAARKLRLQGMLPVIIYGHEEAPEAVSLVRHDVEVALAHEARTLEVELGGAVKQYLIKDVQYDNLDHIPVHLDLTRVSLDERVTVRVGIELRGTPRGVAEGGVLDQLLPDLEVECRVTDIPETFRPLITELGIGEALMVKDLGLPAGVQAVVDGEEIVAVVRALVEIEEPEPVTEGEEESAEPERIGRVRKEEGPAGQEEGSSSR